MKDASIDFEAVPAATELVLRRALPIASREERRYLRIHPPQWLKSRGELAVIYDQQDLLLRDGRVVWGRIVQANSNLFTPKLHIDSPGTIIFCPDPGHGHPVEVLTEIAADLFRLKEAATFENEDEERYGHMLADEHIAGMDWSVPESLSRGERVRSTTIMLPRKHLLGHHLARSIFPILVHPSTSATMLVPERYWPDSFRGWWSRRVKSEPPHDPVPKGMKGALARIRHGLGFFTAFPLGCLLTVALFVAPIAIGLEMRFHLKGDPVAMESAMEAAGRRDDDYITFSATLDYDHSVSAEENGADLLIPVLGTDNKMVVFRAEEDLPPPGVGNRPEGEESITGRVIRKDSSSNPRWSVPGERVPVLHRFRNSELSFDEDLVVVSDNEHPGLDGAQVLTWSLLAGLGLFFASRVVRTVKMFRDDEFCYRLLSKAGYEET